jgi:hypothetical protein
MPTRVEYLYRDGFNYKQWTAVVFGGTCDAGLLRRLSRALDGEERFIAHQVHLPELFFTERPLYADDHCWHEMGEVMSTSDAPDDLLNRSIEDFIAEVESASADGWAAFDRLAQQFGFRAIHPL